MQSDRNSFCGNVVLDSVNIKHKDVDNICQLYENQVHLELFYYDFYFWRAWGISEVKKNTLQQLNWVWVLIIVLIGTFVFYYKIIIIT